MKVIYCDRYDCDVDATTGEILNICKCVQGEDATGYECPFKKAWLEDGSPSHVDLGNSKLF